MTAWVNGIFGLPGTSFSSLPAPFGNQEVYRGSLGVGDWWANANIVALSLYSVYQGALLGQQGIATAAAGFGWRAGPTLALAGGATRTLPVLTITDASLVAAGAGQVALGLTIDVGVSYAGITLFATG